MTDNQPKIAQLTKQLQLIDYEKLDISSYDLEYLHLTFLAGPEYYFNRYAECVEKSIRDTGLDVSDITFVDYGGGQGFLSMIAKTLGIRTVIYTDIRKSSHEVVQQLKTLTGAGPDILIEGDSDALTAYCLSHNLQPDILIGMDVIEHIYDLSVFFADISHINPQLYLLFVTASTPFNPFKKRRLHTIMTGCETGDLENPNFYTLRLHYIQEQFPDLPEEETIRWAQKTKGLIYKDIRDVIDKNGASEALSTSDNTSDAPRSSTAQAPSGVYHPVLAFADPYNTCDPATGNWAERILSIREYEDLVAPYGYQVEYDKGYYNTHRKNPLTAFIAWCVNIFIRYSGRAGFLLSPLIVLTMRKGSKT